MTCNRCQPVGDPSMAWSNMDNGQQRIDMQACKGKEIKISLHGALNFPGHTWPNHTRVSCLKVDRSWDWNDCFITLDSLTTVWYSCWRTRRDSWRPFLSITTADKSSSSSYGYPFHNWSNLKFLQIKLNVEWPSSWECKITRYDSAFVAKLQVPGHSKKFNGVPT